VRRTAAPDKDVSMCRNRLALRFEEEGAPAWETRHESSQRRIGRAGFGLTHRVRRSAGGERNLSAVVRSVLWRSRWRQKLRLYLVPAVHDDGDARLGRILRAESLVPGLRQRPGERQHASRSSTEILSKPLEVDQLSHASLSKNAGSCARSRGCGRRRGRARRWPAAPRRHRRDRLGTIPREKGAA
jgi:hypothetical protein